MHKPIVAIVGRPNVGKSLLFNKLAGRRLSIVEDTPGVTRDRLYADCEWGTRAFSLVDTGGIEPHTGDEMLRVMRRQAGLAIEGADVILFLTDLRTGVTAADVDVAQMLLRAKRPILLAVNKSDSVGPDDPGLYEFYNLGLGRPYPLSALHGLGIGDLLDACVALFPPPSEGGDTGEAVTVAIIGKPNVGKSSLVNRILGEERVIVSETPGTTRDAVDSAFENRHGSYVLIDTAGMRRRARVHDAVEYYSVLRAQMAVDRCQVCLLLIDAGEGVTEQDAKVAGIAHEAGKPSVIVLNKWDLVEKGGKAAERLREGVRARLAFMPYAPVVTLSALTGARLDSVFPEINRVYAQSRTRVSTGQLNSVLADAQARVQPPSDKGRRLKVLYITQAGIQPPHLVAFVNDVNLFHFSYRRYLENQFRAAFGLDATPIRMTARQRNEK
ncbi:MAG: ribosome biogenesis GTPase Der [Oscillospiraceae bacterium]|nr:ribosome biogenesis GTPase Der [Oscillospiraceae bacterium]